MKKILYLTEELPFDKNKNGSTLMNHFILKGLSQKYDVTIISYYSDIELDNITSKFRINRSDIYLFEKTSNFEFLKKFFAVCLFKSPFTFLRNSKLYRKFNSFILSGKFDHIIIDSHSMEIYGRRYPNIINLSLHDSLSLLYKTIYKSQSSLQRFISLYFSFLYMRVEKSLIIRYRKVFFVSKDDPEYLFNNKIPSNVVVIPNGVEFNSPKVSDKIPNSIVFSGVLDYLPNVDACVNFCKNILPNLVDSNPEIKFFIVGRNPTSEILNLQSDNIIIVGEVNNMIQHLSRYQIYISPLRIGAGFKNKIVEAVIANLPIVCTQLSLQGINLIDRQDVLVSDLNADFSDNIKKIIYDNGLERSLIKNAEKAVRENYNWDSILQKYIDSIEC